jgi:hypothetical protein
MLYDSQKQGSNPAAKKVAKIPKVMKPGTTKSPETTNKQNLERLRARMVSEGTIEAAEAYRKAKRNM